MRFLHAADIHLDSPLRGLDQYEGAPAQTLRGASRRAFTALVQLALSERVDLVILAGDLYDGDWLDYNTGLFFLKSVRSLQQAGIPLVMLSGNHDAASRITSQLTLPEGIIALPTAQPGTKRFEHLRVAVHGQGFATQAETRNLAVTYPAPIPGWLNIGVLHTALDGREGHESYAPCTISDLIALGYDYWALGHIHKRESVNGSLHPRVEFPGNIQGRHARETGPKGCLLVTVGHDGQATPEFRPLDVCRWEVIAVDAAPAESVAEVLETARATVNLAHQDAGDRLLAARVTITCSEAVGLRIAADLEHFRADLRGQVGDGIWVEKVKLAPRSETRAQAPTFGDDATSELHAVLDELRAQPDLARAVFASGACGKLINRLPPELRALLEQSHEEVFARAWALLRASSTGPSR
jgi:DNA repair protein SbcD/Mre11